MLKNKKILIIGALGVGKSTLSYHISKKLNIPRLNLDEIYRNRDDGSYKPIEVQYEQLNNFQKNNSSWVVEGSQRHLYEKLSPDIIVHMKINRLIRIFRFTYRFFKAKKLIGKNIDKNLPVQAYHYRKITFKKIRDYDVTGEEINQEIKSFLKTNKIPVINCRGYKDYQNVFNQINSI